MSIFENDPYETLIEAFENLYPDLNYRIFWVPEIKDEDGNMLCGSTFFPEDEDFAVIEISVDLKTLDAVEILAHELAHVVVSIEEGHSEKWEEVFKKIHREYARVTRETKILLG